MRRVLPWAAAAVALLFVVVLSGRDEQSGVALDPRSTDGVGAKALVDLLRESGVDVVLGTVVPESTSDVAVVLRDELSEARRHDLLEWVEAGGTAVVVDPASDLVPALDQRETGLFDSFSADEDARIGVGPQCALPVVSKVRRVQAPQLLAYRVPTRAVGCFPVRRGRAVVFVPRGNGTIVAVGGGAPFANAFLDEADNAVLALSLMAPPSGGGVVVLERTEAGGGDDDLFDLVDAGVKRGFWQLVVAFGVLVLWRARRLGSPPLEPQPVDVEGSELVTAVGRLLEKAGKRDQAAAMLRLHLRRTLSERLGVPLDAPAEALAGAAAAATSLPAERVAAALADAAPLSDADLVRLANDIASVRSELTHAR